MGVAQGGKAIMVEAEVPYGMQFFNAVRKLSGYDVVTRMLSYTTIQNLKQADPRTTLFLVFGGIAGHVHPDQTFAAALLADLWVQRVREHWTRRQLQVNASSFLRGARDSSWSLNILMMKVLAQMIGFCFPNRKIASAMSTQENGQLESTDNLKADATGVINLPESLAVPEGYGARFLDRLKPLSLRLPFSGKLSPEQIQELAQANHEQTLKILFRGAGDFPQLYREVEPEACAELYVMDRLFVVQLREQETAQQLEWSQWHDSPWRY